MQSIELSNFIYSKSNAMSQQDCEQIIEAGNKMMSFNPNHCYAGQNDKEIGRLFRHDYQLEIPRVLSEWYGPIQDCIFDGLGDYQQQISSCTLQILLSPTCKWQYTPVGGGFSSWHIEQEGGSTCNRSLAWMIYLNDVEGGGETEFLYQHQKIKPKTGKLVIWPAGITHPHRGNPPYSNDKFVLTGWFEVASNHIYQELIVKHNKGIA